jgi:hemerythrin-like domain-containing protein
MNEEFVNSYIDILHKKIEELTRSDIMNQTRLVISERLIQTLQEEKQNLIVEVEKLQASLNKRAAKSKENDF